MAKGKSKSLFECAECGEAFSRAVGLGAHRWRAHGIKGKSRRPAKVKSRKLVKKKAGVRLVKKGSDLFSVMAKIVSCPECSTKVSKGGMGSHRRFKHGVAGSSKWTLKKRGTPKPGVETTTSSGVTSVKLAVAMAKFTSGGTIREILEKAAAFRAQASEAENKAERLFKMAAELKELM